MQAKAVLNNVVPRDDNFYYLMTSRALMGATSLPSVELLE